MAKYCPETNDYVLYLDCLECDTRSCENTKDENNGKDIEETTKKASKEKVKSKN